LYCINGAGEEWTAGERDERGCLLVGEFEENVFEQLVGDKENLREDEIDVVKAVGV
jgi:hypothetical protein